MYGTRLLRAERCIPSSEQGEILVLLPQFRAMASNLAGRGVLPWRAERGLRLPSMGQLLPASGPPAHRGAQDVEVPQKLRHHQVRAASGLVPTRQLCSSTATTDGPCCFLSTARPFPCREALGSFTARQLRLMMCLQPWNAPMTFGEQAKVCCSCPGGASACGVLMPVAPAANTQSVPRPASLL